MQAWEVTTSESGHKLLSFLKEKMGEGYSLRFLKKAIESNRCKINGRVERFASALVGKGDKVSFNIESLPKKSQKINLFDPSRILYEDADFLVYDKPSNLASDSEPFLEAVKKHHAHLELIHRLDRDTTGVLMFAKNKKIRQAMIALFKDQLVAKTYLALVDGSLTKTKGIIQNYLGKKRQFEGQTIWGEVSKEQGLSAITEWELLKKGKQASLVICYPKTGRTHQIRVHLSEMGYPILGDHQYGRHFKCTYQPPRYLLHASEISFLHPQAERKIHIQAPLPEDFQKAMETLL
jgi:RluA family pseudouridine synthase